MVVDRFNKLRFGHIVGIIDAYGSVHSQFTDDRVVCHEEFWPICPHVRWRWCNSESIWFARCREITEEEMESIRNHLTKKYGLKWWENGHHDIDHLLNISKSKKKNK